MIFTMSQEKIILCRVIYNKILIIGNIVIVYFNDFTNVKQQLNQFFNVVFNVMKP